MRERSVIVGATPSRSSPTGSSWPTLISMSSRVFSRGGSCDAPPGCCASGAGITWGRPGFRSASPCVTGSSLWAAPFPPVQSGCSRSRARGACASTQSASTTASTNRASTSNRSWPRSRTLHGGSATRISSRRGRAPRRCCRPASPRRSTCLRSWAWTMSTRPARVSPGRRYRCTSSPAAQGRRPSRPRPASSATSSRRAPRRGSAPRLRYSSASTRSAMAKAALAAGTPA
jgi:hypothetical protein